MDPADKAIVEGHVEARQRLLEWHSQEDVTNVERTCEDMWEFARVVADEVAWRRELEEADDDTRV